MAKHIIKRGFRFAGKYYAPTKKAVELPPMAVAEAAKSGAIDIQSETKSKGQAPENKSASNTETNEPEAA